MEHGFTRILPINTEQPSRNQIVLLGVFLASFASWRLICRSAFTAKTQRTPRNPPSRILSRRQRIFTLVVRSGITATKREKTVHVRVNVHVDVDVDVYVDGSCHAKILSRRARIFGLVVRR